MIEQITEELADAIKKLSEVGEALQKSDLTQKTQILLLHDITGVGKQNIKKVLDGLPQLKFCLRVKKNV